MRAGGAPSAVDPDLFPPAFLASSPPRRPRSSASARERSRGRARPARAVIPFRGHREYRVGDDLRRATGASSPGTGRRSCASSTRSAGAHRGMARRERERGPLRGRGAAARAAAISCRSGSPPAAASALRRPRGGGATLADVQGNAALQPSSRHLGDRPAGGRASSTRSRPCGRGSPPRPLALVSASHARRPGRLHAIAGAGSRGDLHLRRPPLPPTRPATARGEGRRDGEVRAVRWSEARPLASPPAPRSSPALAPHAVQPGSATSRSRRHPAEDVLRRVALETP